MGVIVEIKSKDFRGKMDIDHLNDSEKKQVIKGFFDAVITKESADEKGASEGNIINAGKEKEVDSNPTKLPSEYIKEWLGAENNLNKVGTLSNQGNPIKARKVQKSEGVGRNKKLPLLGSEKRMTTPVSDLLFIDDPEDVEGEQKDDEPEFWKTGIKVDDNGRERYKLRYWCGCGNRGNHYIPLGAEVVTCHECKNEMDVQNATGEFDEDGVPTRDDYGNFYIAKHN